MAELFGDNMNSAASKAEQVRLRVVGQHFFAHLQFANRLFAVIGGHRRIESETAWFRTNMWQGWRSIYLGNMGWVATAWLRTTARWGIESIVIPFAQH